MFKKFRKLAVPLLLTSFSPFLVNSPAHASTYWTDWHKCTFSVIHNTYTPWRARIVVRSDGAARPEQVEFGPAYQNDERINSLNASDSWDSGGRHRISPAYAEATQDNYGGSSQNFNTATWVAKKYPRYARIVLFKTDGNDVCTSEIRM